MSRQQPSGLTKLLRKIPWVLAGFCLLTCELAYAASFDCGKAGTEVEKLICSDETLSRLDEELATAYTEALAKSPEPERIKAEQKQWLWERNACSRSDCVKRAQEMRLRGLSSFSIPQAAPDEEASLDSTSPASREPLYGHCVDVMSSFDCGAPPGREQSGKGYTVCETYLKHLNTLSEPPKCEAPVPPGFTEPEWEEVDFMQHLDWAYQIAKARFIGGEYDVSFDEWKMSLLQDLASGRIVPQMRKTQVWPLVGNPVTLLAFTEDSLGCSRPAIAENSRHSSWRGVGFRYLLMLDDPTKPLRKIAGGTGLHSPSTYEAVLLLYAGKPYFVQGGKKNVNLMDITYLQVLSLYDGYATKQLCNFSIVSKGKPFRTN